MQKTIQIYKPVRKQEQVSRYRLKGKFVQKRPSLLAHSLRSGFITALSLIILQPS